MTATQSSKLQVIGERIHNLQKPAYVKNSELRYVVANKAYCTLLGLDSASLIGRMTEDLTSTVERLDLTDRERRCMVFGEDQLAPFSDPFGAGRYQVEIERFSDDNDDLYLFGVFEPVTGQVRSAPPVIQPVAAMPAGQSVPMAALAGLSQADFFDAVDVGVCLFDADERLVYINPCMSRFYRDVVEGLAPGVTLTELLEKAWKPNGTPAGPETDKARADWVAQRLAFHRQPQSMDVNRLPDGRWIQSLNRRLPDGQIVCLRIDITGQKEREELLEKTVADSRTLKVVLDESPVATFVRDRDHRLVFANQAYAALMGLPMEKLLGSVETDLFGGSASALAAGNEHILATGEAFNREEDFPGPDGRIRNVLTKISRVTGDDGNFYMVGSMTDIGDLRRREEELQRAQQATEAVHRDFEDIVSTIEVGLMVLDADLRIEMVNDALLGSWAGYDQGERQSPVGMLYTDLLAILNARGHLAGDPATFQAMCEERCAEIRKGPIARRELAVDNGPALLFSSRPLSSGKYLLSYVDITELRALDREVAAAQKDAARALELVRDATDTMPQGLMVIDGEQIIFANETLHRLLDLPRDMVDAGAQWRGMFRLTSPAGTSSEEVASQEDRFAEALTASRPMDYDFPLSGDRWIRLQSRPNSEGHMVVLFTELTQVRAREAELQALVARAEAADRAKSEFLANMSHEIRTPMNGILGMAELLSKTRLDTRQQTFVDIVVKSGHALLTIINDVLDFSRLDAGQMQLRLVEFDPGEAVEDVASLLASRASDKSLELVVSRDPALPPRVEGDAGRFRQIVTNLVGNALKFTEQGHVLVRIGCAADQPGTIELSVTDSGIGIPADKLGIIFEKFSQVDGSATRRHEGAGLGLAITAGLVRLQGGTISVDSQPGQGSTFTVRLPMATARSRPRPQGLPVNISGARILVIDDNAVNRAILIEQMDGWGFDAVAVESGEAGLDILEAAHDSGLPVDAVILDYHMPDANGAAVARMIRLDERFENVQLIFLTSMDIATDDRIFADLNVAAQLMKPARSDVLRETLISVLRAAGRQSDKEPAGLVRAIPAPRRRHEKLVLDADHAEAPMLTSSAKDGLPVTVLIAEDNEVNQIVFRQILEQAGIGFRIVENGSLALEAWAIEQPDIILMDVSMPVLSGLDATRMIREREAGSGKHVPIIGITAHALDGDRDMCLDCGMDDYIAKPVSPDRLQTKIREWLAKGHADRSSGQGRH